MNSRQAKLIRILQFIFYPAAAIMLIAFAWDFYRLWTGSGVEVLSEGERPSETDWWMLAAAVMFWVVFMALLIEFLAREIFRRQPREGLGTIVLEIGSARGPVRFIPVLAVAPFVVGFNFFLLRPDVLAIDMQRVSIAEHLIFWLFYGVAHLLFVGFLLRAIRHRPFLIVTDKGFLYEPGDISPGLIRWEDVAEIKEAELLYGQGVVSGPSLRPVLAVRLKDPEKYARRYTPLLGLLNRLFTKVISFQTGGPGDVILAVDDLGERHREVRALFVNYLKERGVNL